MINYFRSDYYRLLRKKSLHLTSLISLLLIVSAAVVLYFSNKFDPTFPYATSTFFYSNVIGGIFIILVVSFLFNLSLTGKDLELMKHAVSFGISRQHMYWSKLILTLSYLLVISLLGMGLMIGLGETLFTHGSSSIQQFVMVSFNMLPIVLSAFFVIHTLNMLRVPDIFVLITVLIIYTMSGNLLYVLLKYVPILNELYLYAPSTLLNNNLLDFKDGTVTFDMSTWLLGTIISAIVLLLGPKLFSNRMID